MISKESNIPSQALQGWLVVRTKACMLLRIDCFL